jgi:GT2 family glycosyltransferase
MDQQPIVSFVIVSWNTSSYLRRCLHSLAAGCKGILSETIVVDNASDDGSPQMVSSEFPSVKLIQTGANLGFAKANNIGIRNSRGRYLCLVNSDVEVFPETIPALCRLLNQDQKIGMTAPRVLNTDGSPQASCRREPTLWNSLCRALSLDTLLPDIGFFAGGLMLPSSSAKVMPVDVLTGCFWLIRRETLESVRQLDEQFFMYGEDLDLCKRIRDAGWKIVYSPASSIIHHGGASSADAPSRYFIELHRSQLQYWRKHHSKTKTFTFLLTLWTHNILRLIGCFFAMAISPRRRQACLFRIDRSWQCLKWLTENGFQYCRTKPKETGAVGYAGLASRSSEMPMTEPKAVTGSQN